VDVAFEVLSPSTERRNLRWKRTAYTSLPSLTHYIAIAQDAVEVIVFARDDDFEERRTRSLDKTIELRSAFHCRWRKSIATPIDRVGA
jgi:Uma2 family endonuclease